MKKWLCLLLAMVCLSGCTSSDPTVTKELYAMDTIMQLTAYTDDQTVLLNGQKEILRLEQLLSVTMEQSEISVINAANGQWVTVSDETAQLLTMAKLYATQTQGAFDPTIYPATIAWGFTTDRHTVPTTEQLAELCSVIDYTALAIEGNRVHLPQGMGLDLGAIAKGYAADRVKLCYDQANVSGILSLGGNILTIGKKPSGEPFTVAVQHPNDSSATLGTLSLSGGKAAVTSGDYQRYFEQNGVTYHHILDPATAAPAQNNLTSVTVIADSAAAADAYATALYVVGEERARSLVKTLGISALLVTHDNRVICLGNLDFTLTAPAYSLEKDGE